MKIVALDPYTFIMVPETVTEAEMKDIHPRMYFHLLEKFLEEIELLEIPTT